MAQSQRYYIAHNGGLKLLQPQGSSMNAVGEFFQGKTLEHLIGCTKKPEVVFAAVAFEAEIVLVFGSIIIHLFQAGTWFLFMEEWKPI